MHVFRVSGTAKDYGLSSERIRHRTRFQVLPPKTHLSPFAMDGEDFLTDQQVNTSYFDISVPQCVPNTVLHTSGFERPNDRSRAQTNVFLAPNDWRRFVRVQCCSLVGTSVSCNCNVM